MLLIRCAPFHVCTSADTILSLSANLVPSHPFMFFSPCSMAYLVIQECHTTVVGKEAYKLTSRQVKRVVDCCDQRAEGIYTN